jgi:hypothetical protein
MTSRTKLWRRVDTTGLELFRLERLPWGWKLGGTVILIQEGTGYDFVYEVRCDEWWRARQARVSGHAGDEALEVRVETDGEGRWWWNGEEQPQVAGCVDVDLAFTPATNTLPIRRLRLPVGASAPVRAAWLRFPDFSLGLLEQAYRREGERSYRYESGGGSFTAALEVDDDGLVRQYGELWRAE